MHLLISSSLDAMTIIMKQFEWAGKCALIVACMISGALTTVTCKAMFETTVVLTDGSIATFGCPFFASLLNFLAISMLVLLQKLVEYGLSCMPSRSQMGIVPEAFSSYDIVRYIFGWHNLVNSAFNVFAVLCTQTALVFVPATLHAALRNGNIPMVVAIRIYMFDKSCSQHQLIGIGIFTLGVVLMAVSSHASNDQLGVATHYGAGIFLMFVASALLAARYVSEEILMQHARIPPMVVVGAQGFTGSILSAILLLFAHHIGYEDFGNTVRMLCASSQVQILVMGYVALGVVYNLTVAYTTKIFDATCKAMVRGTKPMLVWSLQLLCFYSLDSTARTHHYGEPWVHPRSWCVLFAVVIVSSGLCLYFDDKPRREHIDDEEDVERVPLIKK